MYNLFNQTSWYPSYIAPLFATTPNVIPQLSPADLISLQMECERTAIHTNAQLILKAADRDNKIMIEQFKKQKDFQIMAAREEYRRKRETMTSAVILDSNGRMRREIHYGEGDSRLTAPLCNLSGFRFVVFTALEADSDDFILEVSASGLERPILLNSGKMEASVLKKKLRSRGVTVQIPRRDLKSTLEDMLTLFVHFAVKTEVPFTTGWCLTTAGWCFTRDSFATFLGKREEADHDA